MSVVHYCDNHTTKTVMLYIFFYLVLSHGTNNCGIIANKFATLISWVSDIYCFGDVKFCDVICKYIRIDPMSNDLTVHASPPHPY